MSMQRLAELLGHLGLDPSAQDMLDVLWLASHVGSSYSDLRRDTGASEIFIPSSDAIAPEPTGLDATYIKAADSEKYAFHLRPVGDHVAGGAMRAMPVRAPAAQALGGQLNLTKALRPLKRKVNSRHHVVLDEEATASKIADEGLWIPALTPAPARWLELALVVDGYESMSIWRKPIAELLALVEGLGTFRDVRYWTLDHARDDPRRLGLRRRAGSALRSPRELIDPIGRRLIVVVSDCLGPIWQSQAAQGVLAEWARRGPVAIIQPLPERLWRYSHAEPVAVRLHAFQPGAPNARLSCTVPPGALAAPPPKAVPVPVLQLDAAWLASWSQLLAASGARGVDAQVTFVGGDAEQTVPALAEEAPRTAAQRVDDFRLTASPGAVRLAEYLAAVPISLPVIRLVQKEMLGSSNQSQLAEVFLGGLLYRIDSQRDVDPDDVMYDLIPGVRELLLGQLPVHEAIRTLETVSDYVGAQFGQARDFRAVLVGGDLAGDLVIGPDSMPFARVAAEVLGFIGGNYSAPAESLAQALPQTYLVAQPDITLPPSEMETAAEPHVTRDEAYEEEFRRILARISVSDRRSKRKPLVCPYCYHAFAERDILFRCSGRPSGGRPACPPERDQVLEEKLGQPAMLPPVFEADAHRDIADCPRCHRPTRSQVCPACHSTLPATFRNVQGRLIALVGPSEAGKTAFMTVLVHELWHQAGDCLEASIMGADESTQDRYVNHYEWPMYQRSEFMRTVPGNNRPAPLVFRYTMNQQARFRSNPHELLLSFADSAGEDLVSVEKIELMARYLAAADAVLVLIDPLQFPAVREQLRPETPMPIRAVGIGETVSVFNRITSLLLAGNGQEMIEKPVAIILSKLDVLWQLLSPDDLLRRQRTVLPFFDNQDSREVQVQVRALLERWEASGIDETAKRYYRLFRYFAVSALGVTPSLDNRVAEDGIRPYRVTEPFTWLLSRFGFIRTS